MCEVCVHTGVSARASVNVYAFVRLFSDVILIENTLHTFYSNSLPRSYMYMYT